MVRPLEILVGTATTLCCQTTVGLLLAQDTVQFAFRALHTPLSTAVPDLHLSGVDTSTMESGVLVAGKQSTLDVEDHKVLGLMYR